MMRADIATMNQGIRNTADAISMIQTADGALGVIDEKLIRMKELAEQASTGTYTTAQREIINSEYQAMAAEIDRIANATNFNGIKLLDGSVTNQHGGQGLKIHFGVSNNPAEDYYFVNIGDSRATSSTGLRVGGDAKNDIWGQGAAGSGPLAGPGCCTAGYSSLDGDAGFTSGQTFSYGYNWDWTQNSDSALLTGRYLAGRYTVTSSDSLQALVNKVNAGSQSRVGIQFDATSLYKQVLSGGTVAVCIGDEAYVFGSARVAGGEFSAEVPAVPDTFTVTGKGSYTNNSVLQNIALGYTLNDAQIKALSAAGIDRNALRNMGFTAATVSGVGSATNANSALALSQARDSLVGALNRAWNSLGLGTSGLTVDAGVTTGFQVGSTTVTKSGNGDQAINQETRTINGKETLIVNTGVYANTSGNWTTDSELASLFGLHEVVYYIENTNSAKYVATCTFNFTDSFVTRNAYLAFNGDVNSAINNAGLKFRSTFTAINPVFTMSATGETSEIAKNLLITSAQAKLNDDYYKHSALNLTYTYDAGGSRTLITSSMVGTTIGSSGNVRGKVSLSAGIYVDSAGNWTESATIASAFSVKQLAIIISGGTGTSSIIFKASGTGSAHLNTVLTTALNDPGNALYNILNAGHSSTDILNLVNAGVGDLIAKLQSDALLKGQQSVKLDGGGLADPPYLGLDNLNAKLKVDTVGTDDLSATAYIGSSAFIAGPSATGFDVAAGNGFSALAADSTVSYIAQALAESITNLLADKQGTGKGRIRETATSLPPVAISTGDIKGFSSIKVKNEGSSAYTTTIVVDGAVDISKTKIMVASAGTSQFLKGGENSGQSNFGAFALASAINHNANSEFWAMVQSVDSNGNKADMVYVFAKEGGNKNDLLACDVGGSDSASRAALDYVDFENVAAAEMHEDGTSFTLGGEHWGTMTPTQSRSYLGTEVWNVTLNGRDVGKERDLWIANAGEINTPALSAKIINGMDRNSFVEIQNAADSPWAGGEVRTQSTAQEALDAITEAINTKDKIRADLGALQNRLENTMTNLTVQAENLQASESRISDVDVATEMTEFTRNNVLAQAATSMLAQANSLSQLALSLIG
jgi:flagellin